MKRFLLFCGDTYYPSGGWKDFKGDFDMGYEATRQAAAERADWWQIVDTRTKEIVDENDAYLDVKPKRPSESLLSERDDIGSLPIPASAKRYARRKGLAKMLPGVGPDEYFAMVRDATGGPVKGFPTTDVGVTMGGARSGSKGLATGKSTTQAQRAGRKLVDHLIGNGNVNI